MQGLKIIEKGLITISHITKRISLILILLFTTNLAWAQRSIPDVIEAHAVSAELNVDGNLDEIQWNQAKRISNFTQRELEEGQPATEKTEVAVLYNENNLYIGVWCFDRRPDQIIAKKMQRDFHWNGEDNFEIIIDTYHNQRDGYLFVTNPNGARADVMVLNNGQHFNRNWDGVWDVKTTVTDEGWFAEFAIPFSTLKFSNKKKQVWGMNFERNIRRKQEQVMWQGWSRDSELEQISRAGTLIGLDNLEDVNLLELKPYVLGGWQNESGEEAQTNFNFGGDLNYLITPTLKLNLTANTDFAQVESDRVQINLSRFSLYYPEKREFFLEGADYFDFGLGRRLQPFYSRRIGLDPDGMEIPIIGGARILGKQGSSTVGAMSIQTAEQDSIPSANYSVLRWKQDVGRQSGIGLIGVGKFEPGRQNGVVGADFLYSTSTFLNDKILSVGGAYAVSYTSDSSETTGNSQRFFISYPSDLIEFDFSWERSGQSFNPEVGFLRRENYQLLKSELQFNPRPAFMPFIRNLEFKPLDIDYYYDDQSGRLISFSAEFRPLGFLTKSGEFFEFNIQRTAENLEEEFEIYEDVIIPQGEYWFTHYEMQFHTFSGRPLFGYGSVNWGDFYNGQRKELYGRIVWRMNEYLSISYDLERNIINLPSGNFIVNEQSGRIEIALNPDLFGAVFGQWNNEDQEAIFNFRLNWIPKPGANFYFVVNQSFDTKHSDWSSTNTTILSKLIWRFEL